MSDLADHQQDLARADEHINRARDLIQTQRRTIAGLLASRQDPNEAEALLAHLEESLAFLMLHRLRLAEYVDNRLRQEGESKANREVALRGGHVGSGSAR